MPIQKNQLTRLLSLRGRKPVAIRSISGPTWGRAVQNTAGDADCHSPAGFAMTEVDMSRTSFLCRAIVQPGRRGQCRTPYSPNFQFSIINFQLKYLLHFPFIRARISIVNAKALIGLSCVRIAYERESGIGGSRSAQSTGLSPGSCRLKSMETRVRRCDRRYRVEGVSAPDRVRRKANAGGTAEDFFRSFVPRYGDGRPFFRSLCPPLWGGWLRRSRVRCGIALFF